MATIELPRVPTGSLRLPTEQNLETKPFYDSGMPQLAREKLGYSYAAEQQAAEAKTLEKNQSFNSLLDALDQLKIQPLDPNRVQAYKAKMQRGGRRLYWTALPLFILCGIVAVFCLVARLIPALHPFVLGVHTNVVSWAVVIPQVLSGSLILFARKKGLDNYWHTTSLNCYDQVVPSYALDLACRVHQELPDAHFRVESFHVHNRPWPDPFLTVTDGKSNNKVYLTVWNEPSFYAKPLA